MRSLYVQQHMETVRQENILKGRHIAYTIKRYGFFSAPTLYARTRCMRAMMMMKIVALSEMIYEGYTTE